MNAQGNQAGTGNNVVAVSHLAAGGQTTELAVIEVVARTCVASQAEHTDGGGTQLGHNEGEVGQQTGPLDDRPALVADNEHKGLTGHGHLDIQQGAHHGTTDVLLLSLALLQNGWHMVDLR